MPENEKSQIKVIENKLGVVTIALGENVHGGNEAVEFSAKLIELSHDYVKYVIIDLRNVKMMNSSGLGMLVAGLNTLKKANITMYLAGVTEKIEHLLRMTHLDKVFKTFIDYDDAVESCN